MLSNSSYMENDMETDYSFEDLLKIVAQLRSENGCPWDKSQTLDTMKKYILEEAYEVVDAVEKESYLDICEELGDVLFQVVIQTQIAKEEDKFTIEDVIKSICEKMISRHPHVFADEKIDTADEVNARWHEIKKQEKSQDSYTKVLKDIPKSMSALMRSNKIQKKAALVGFDWDNPMDALAKVYEETEEVKELINSDDKEKLTKEIGDLLFAVVNVSRMLGIDPETALLTTNNKFINRFEYIEKNSIKIGKDLKNMTLEEMDKFWEESKRFYK